MKPHYKSGVGGLVVSLESWTVICCNYLWDWGLYIVWVRCGTLLKDVVADIHSPLLRCTGFTGGLPSTQSIKRLTFPAYPLALDLTHGQCLTQVWTTLGRLKCGRHLAGSGADCTMHLDGWHLTGKDADCTMYLGGQHIGKGADCTMQP